MAHGETKLLDWDKLEVGEKLPGFSYVLTQEMIDDFRNGVQDPRRRSRPFPTRWTSRPITRRITTTDR